MPAMVSDTRHIQLATNIARSLSGTALDHMDTIPNVLTTASQPRRKRRSTVFQRRISTDQFTVVGRTMRRRDYSGSRNKRSRSLRRSRSASDRPSSKRKSRGRSWSQRRSKSLPRLADDPRFGRRNDEFERKVKKQSRITSVFGDWKHRIWKKSQ